MNTYWEFQINSAILTYCVRLHQVGLLPKICPDKLSCCSVQNYNRVVHRHHWLDEIKQFRKEYDQCTRKQRSMLSDAITHLGCWPVNVAAYLRYYILTCLIAFISIQKSVSQKSPSFPFLIILPFWRSKNNYLWRSKNNYVKTAHIKAQWFVVWITHIGLMSPFFLTVLQSNLLYMILLCYMNIELNKPIHKSRPTFSRLPWTPDPFVIP